jgi:hypothetical protein
VAPVSDANPAVIRGRALAAALAGALAGCGDLVGFGGEVPPLATVHVTATGDFEAVRVPNATGEDLRVALVWGTQWLPEPLCFLPPESPAVAAAVAAGCRDPLAFTPARVTAGAAIAPGVPVELTLFELPSAEVMIGDVTARVAYGSLVVFDDRDHDGTLALARSRRLPAGGFDPETDSPTSDVIYGASFVAMTEPDTRLAFREGAFVETGFYPRHGCGAPLPAFSILSAGGFSLADAIAATAAGQLPAEDPARCAEAAPGDAAVEIPLRPNDQIREVGCEQRRLDSSVRYRQPPVDAPDLAGRAFACAKIPSFGGDGAATDGIIQLVVASRPEDTCRGLTHYTLIGCDEGALQCDAPEWDYRASPPGWWPCPI